jgi:hypothetical protein
MRWTFDAELLLYEWDDGELTSVLIPEDISDAIRGSAPKRPFGAVRVNATVREIRWETLLYREKQSGCYAMAVKKKVRVAAGLEPGETITVTLELV